MTPHQRILHWRRYAQRQTAIENAFMPRMEAAIGEQYKSFTAAVKTHGFEYAKGNIAHIVKGEKIHDAISRLYKLSALQEASFNYSKLKEQHLKFRGFGFNEEWTTLVQTYLTNIELLNTVRGITDTTKGRILSVISKGIEQGLGVEDIVNLLKSDELTTARARVIVRTESVAATNLGSMIGAMSTGIMYDKEWVSALDHRVRGLKPSDRFSHIALNGDVVDMSKPFNNGESIRYPGDKKASAGNVICCRCTMGYIAKRDENGRIMRYDSNTTEQPRTQSNSMSKVLLQVIAGTILGNVVNSFAS